MGDPLGTDAEARIKKIAAIVEAGNMLHPVDAQWLIDTFELMRELLLMRAVVVSTEHLTPEAKAEIQRMIDEARRQPLSITGALS